MTFKKLRLHRQNDGARRSPPPQLQICSDLHIEFYGRMEDVPEDIIIPRAPVLALLGDIGLANTKLLQEFLWFQAKRFEHVLVVAGNHEYYNQDGGRRYTFQEQQDWLRRACEAKENLHFLERDAVEVNGTLILGTTLWSFVSEKQVQRAERYMNDYNICYTATNDEHEQQQQSTARVRKLSVKDTNAEFLKSVEWLKEQISQFEKKQEAAAAVAAVRNSKPSPSSTAQQHKTQTKQKPQIGNIVVLTHHTPLVRGTSSPIYEFDELNCCFSTDLPALLRRPVSVWACGHTHWNFNLGGVEEGVRLVSNQRGYPGKEAMDYDNGGFLVDLC